MSDNLADLSSLEREFELEMESAPDGDLEVAFESEADPYQFEQDTSDFEQDDFESELESAFETAFERDDLEREFEAAMASPGTDEFVDRFLEISSRQFESPYEAEAAMSEVLDDIEREYFFGAIKRGLKKLGKNKLLRSLATKGMTLGVNKFFPGLQGALQLARGNVKGALLNFGKQALGSVVPGGGAMLDAVKAIGLGSDSGVAQERETWENYVNLSREAYEHLAENLTPAAHQPGEAMRLANNAVQHAIATARARTSAPSGRGRGPGRVLRLRVAPGERIKLIIAGA